MDRIAFDTYIDTQRAPLREPGTVIILHNLATHKSLKSANLLKQRKCWFLFLPACTPDLNLIGMAFSKLKAHLRPSEAKAYDSLIQALSNICGLFSPNECWNDFKAAGYASC